MPGGEGATMAKRAQYPPDPPANSINDNSIPCLALRPKQAAKALGIGERLLWSKTNIGEIPHVRIGRAVIYPIDLLREYLNEQAKGVKP